MSPLPLQVCVLPAALGLLSCATAATRRPSQDGPANAGALGAETPSKPQLKGGRADPQPDVEAGLAWLQDGREPQPSRALPRVSTRHVGMHLGGESNAPEAKRPWLTAFEGAELDFLRCYRLVKEPLAGGTFGVDLYVPPSGRNAEVRAMRQRLGAEDFETCMKANFESIEFRSSHTPTMLSYSFRFDIDG